MIDLKNYRFDIRNAEIRMMKFTFGVFIQVSSFGSGTRTVLSDVPIQEIERGVQMLRDSLTESGATNFQPFSIYFNEEDGFVIQSLSTIIVISANRGDAEIALEHFEFFLESAKGEKDA